MKKKNYLLLILMLLSLTLMFLPYGVSMTFVNANGIEKISKYAFYDPMVFGYANIFPILILILTVVISGIFIFNKDNRYENLIQKLLLTTIISMVFSYIIFSSFTILSLVILLIHVVVFIMHILLFRIREFDWNN